ncbi:MAG: TetR/AcrR family transcriptional regulator [Gaiellaceae bacterium]
MTKPTAQGIVDAALETLREEGFAGASSRAIARRGAFNQALVFYYFGSLEGLLLAALEQASEERLTRYRAAVADVDSLDALIPVMADLWEQDKASGHVRVISQIIAGAVNRPELAERVVVLMRPWVDLAEETVKRVLPAIAPPRETADAIVTFYLGVNLLTNLDPSTARADAFFAKARELAPLVAPLVTMLSASEGSPDRPSTSPDPASAT